MKTIHTCLQWLFLCSCLLAPCFASSDREDDDDGKQQEVHTGQIIGDLRTLFENNEINEKILTEPWDPTIQPADLESLNTAIKDTKRQAIGRAWEKLRMSVFSISRTDLPKDLIWQCLWLHSLYDIFKKPNKVIDQERIINIWQQEFWDKPFQHQIIAFKGLLIEAQKTTSTLLNYVEHSQTEEGTEQALDTFFNGVDPNGSNTNKENKEKLMNFLQEIISKYQHHPQTIMELTDIWPLDHVPTHYSLAPIPPPTIPVLKNEEVPLGEQSDGELTLPLSIRTPGNNVSNTSKRGFKAMQPFLLPIVSTLIILFFLAHLIDLPSILARYQQRQKRRFP